jgi:hypothetical protein
MLCRKLPKTLRLQKDARSFVDADEPGLTPSLQLLVDTLSRQSDGLSERFLGYQNSRFRHPRRILYLGQPQKGLRQADGQALETQVLDLLACSSETASDNLQEPDADRGILLEDGQNIPTVEYQEFATGHRSGVGRPWPPIEQRYLAEHLVRTNEVENDFTAGRRAYADFDETRQGRKQSVTGVALAKNASTGLNLHTARVRRQLLECGWREPSEELMMRKDCLFVGQSRHRHRRHIQQSWLLRPNGRATNTGREDRSFDR